MSRQNQKQVWAYETDVFVLDDLQLLMRRNKVSNCRNKAFVLNRILNAPSFNIIKEEIIREQRNKNLKFNIKMDGMMK